MTEEDMAAIQARATDMVNTVEAFSEWTTPVLLALEVAESDIPALIAEVNRLRAGIRAEASAQCERCAHMEAEGDAIAMYEGIYIHPHYKTSTGINIHDEPCPASDLWRLL